MEKRYCLQCGTEMIGRADKRFCCDQCRASYNNQHKSDSEKMLKEINSILRKNRTILKSLNPAGMSIVRQEYLIERGFNFKYNTHLYKTKEGNEYRFCYDLGYMMLDNEKIRIVVQQPYMK